MGVSNITITQTGTGTAVSISLSPSNWSKGIYASGTITFIDDSDVFHKTEYVYLFDSLDDYSDFVSDEPVIYSSALINAGETLAVTDLFKKQGEPDEAYLVGKYLYFHTNPANSTPVPIVETPTSTQAPTTVEVSATDVAPGSKVKLSWSEAAAGTNNAITGYRIYRATDPDGPYSLLNTVASTATKGSYTVTAPTSDGASYYYKIITNGTESGYNSDLSQYVELTCRLAAVTAPTTVKLSATNASPNAEVELSWSGAMNGANNPITGYQVYRATSANGDYMPLDDVIETSDTGGSITVVTPTTNFETYYYKVQTLGTLENVDSDLSIVYAALTCTYSTPSAPTSVTFDGKTAIYLLPDTSATLAWSGAEAGTNNPVTGYDVYLNGEVYREGLTSATTSCEVTSADTAGELCTFTVVTLGELSDSARSARAEIYTYSDPAAPTNLSASNDNPSAGSRVRLSWSGAAPGGYNSITGYCVHRSGEVNGEYTRLDTVATTETSGSCFVDAPPISGAIYYYRIETIGAYSTSGLSEVYLQLTATSAAAPDADTTVVVRPIPRPKRKMVFGEYDTVYDGPWTLCEWALSEPTTQTKYVEVTGRMYGPLDMSTYLTGGDPRYSSRNFEARFECSENTRLWREDLISIMMNRLHGQRVDITLPDDDTRYITGRLHVKKDYNDMAHASVTVTAVCDPWRYSKQETQADVLVTETVQDFVLSNNGRRIIVPTVKVAGYKANVVLTCGGHTWTFGAGEYRLPDLVLRQGNTTFSCYGSGVINFTYREAVL